MTTLENARMAKLKDKIAGKEVKEGVKETVVEKVKRIVKGKKK